MGEPTELKSRAQTASLVSAEAEWLRKVARAPAALPLSAAPARSDSLPIAVGDHVGPYVLVRELGRGGMGIVFEAIHTTIGQHAAIKALHRTSSPAALARFLNEARAASSVRHPSVVQVFDFAHLPCGTPYILMELVEGESLRAHLDRTLTLPCAVAVRLCRQIATALAAVHARGIVHRDLKPENLLVCPDESVDGGLRVKILDFGIAHLGDGSDRITLDGRVVGTPAYMAPEQCLGQQVGGACDVYSLGILLLEVLTGSRPFGGHAQDVLRMHVADCPDVSGLPPEVPDRLCAVISLMLQKESVRRPSALEVSSQLAPLEELLRDSDPTANLRASLAVTVLSERVSRVRLRPKGLRSKLALTGACVLAVTALAVSWSGKALPLSLSGMIWIEGAPYRQGSSAADIERECARLGATCRRTVLESEQPARSVTVSPFHLDVHEVTNFDYAQMLNRTPPEYRVDEDREWKMMRFARLRSNSRLLLDLYTPGSGIAWNGEAFEARHGFEQLPVVQVTWDGATLYCQAQGKRLPSEAEWELAARGPEGRRFAWGSQEPGCDAMVFGRDPGLPCEGRERAPSQVGTSPQDRTPLGVLDLGGNVMEWVYDATRRPYHPPCGACVDPRVDGEGPIEQEYRVVRGSAWSNTLYLHSAARGRWKRTAVADDLGFRCAADHER